MCNKNITDAFLILAHVSGGFANRHCRLIIGSWGPMGCEVKAIISLGWGV